MTGSGGIAADGPDGVSVGGSGGGLPGGSAGVSPPRRLVLTVDEFETLRLWADGPRLPAGFRVDHPHHARTATGNGTGARMNGAVAVGVLGSASAAAGVERRLVERGLATADPAVAGGYRVDPALRLSLTVLSGPELLIQTTASVRGGGRSGRVSVWAAHAVAGPLGVGLVRSAHRRRDDSAAGVGGARRPATGRGGAVGCSG